VPPRVARAVQLAQRAAADSPLCVCLTV